MSSESQELAGQHNEGSKFESPFRITSSIDDELLLGNMSKKKRERMIIATNVVFTSETAFDRKKTQTQTSTNLSC